MSLQSGPLGIGLLELADRLQLGISSFVSLGNKADVSANDFLNYWDDDPDTAVVLLYTESFGNPRKFGRIARRVSRRKPIVAVKSGRGQPDDVAADALYQQAGVIRVDSVRQLFDVGRVLDGQPLPAGRRVAVVANADSPAVLALDAPARRRPATGARSPPATCDAIAALAPPEATVGARHRPHPPRRPAALRRRAGDRAGRRRRRRRVAIYAPPISSMVDDVAPPSPTPPPARGKPVLAVTLGRDDGPLAPGSPVPAFAFPEPAAGALGRVARYAAWRRRPGGRGARRWPASTWRPPQHVVAHALERAARAAPCCRWWRRPTCSPPTASRWRRPAPSRTLDAAAGGRPTPSATRWP